MSVAVDRWKFFNFFLISILLFFVASLLYVSLYHDEFLRGTDGYYYALQSDFWFRTGKVKIPDASLIHRLIGLFQYLGFSAENAFRLWISLSVFLFSCMPFASNRVFLTGNKQGVALMSWVLLSPSLVFCAIEFPKIFTLMIAIGVPSYIARRQGKSLYYFLPVATLAMLALHRSAIVYLGFSFLLIGYQGLIKKGSPLRSARVLGLISIFACALIFYKFIIVDHININDFYRTNFKILTPGMISLLLRDSLPVAIKIELLMSSLLAIIILWRAFQERHKLTLSEIFLLGPLLPAFLPSFGSEVFSVGERFAILLPLTLMIVLGSGGSFFRHKALLFLPTRFALYGSVIACVLVISISYRLNYSHPRSIDPPFDQFQVIVKDIESKKIPMLIAHQGLNFFYKYHTKFEAFSYEPEDHWNKMRIWRVVYGLTSDEINYYLPTDCSWSGELVLKLSVELYHLMREDCYVRFRQAIAQQEESSTIYSLLFSTAFNPSQKRPTFLYEKHRNDDVNDEFPALPLR